MSGYNVYCGSAERKLNLSIGRTAGKRRRQIDGLFDTRASAHRTRPNNTAAAPVGVSVIISFYHCSHGAVMLYGAHNIYIRVILYACTLYRI